MVVRRVGGRREQRVGVVARRFLVGRERGVVVRGVAGGGRGRRVVARLLRLRGGLVFVVFVVVVRGDGDASGDEADRAKGGKGCRADVAACGGAGAVVGEGFGEEVFGGDDDRVAVEAAVGLGADQRAFAAGVVVVDDERALAVAEGDAQVVAVARGANVGQAVKLVPGAVNGFDVLFARAVERVLGDGVAVCVFEGDGVQGRKSFAGWGGCVGVGGAPRRTLWSVLWGQTPPCRQRGRG